MNAAELARVEPKLQHYDRLTPYLRCAEVVFKMVSPPVAADRLPDVSKRYGVEVDGWRDDVQVVDGAVLAARA